MLPLHQAYEVRQAVLEYIKATFRFKEAKVGDAFYRFIEDPKNGLFKGPYVSLKTPFVKADENEVIPLDIKPDFQAHFHQVQAFKRLTTHDGHKPEPTLLTTGTGSGKTECFLFPMLDYVYQMNRYEHRQGVKVIILYPMNALASDQAKRLGEAIWNDPRLKGKVTAGLFIGEGTDKKDFPTQMGEHNIIESRDAIVDTVPDILLTNFKMLDYGLMQQRFMPLWKGNIGEKEPMLHFIVLDELHTYDGAQGTDVANLIRRLKLKLNLPAEQLTPIGTSATIGNGEDSKRLLCKYASDVFGEEFTPDSVIEETRIEVDDFFDVKVTTLPVDVQLKKLNIEAFTNTTDYLNLARTVWLSKCPNDAAEIGNRLRELEIVRDLLRVTTKGIIMLDDLLLALGKVNEKFLAMLRVHPDYALTIVESLLALISEAKLPGGKFPLLYLQIQLWQRELSGIQRYVQAEPEFTWRDSIQRDERIALPIYFCRDCGNSGWLSTKKESEQKFGTDTSLINKAFMENEKEIRLMNIESRQAEPIEDYKSDLTISETYYIHPEDLTIGAKTDDNVLRVRSVSRGYLKKNGKTVKFDSKCPLCMSDSLAIVGGRTSTLSSVAVSQVMSSDFDNGDASKRKMLTFSNSVQDAAHLAGFYEVRTFRFLFRQSIQQYLKTVGKAITLKELQEGFKQYWKAKLPRDDYYYRFIPDELVEKIDLTENYRDKDNGNVLSKRFKEEFDLRVDWEICSEFGMMSQRGRTLEKMGASATFFKEDDLRLVFHKMEEWLKENNLEFVAQNETLFLRFTNGVLHRLRQRGGIDHEFLRLYRTQQLKPVMLNWPKMEKIHFLYKHFGRNRVPHMMGYQAPSKYDEVLDVTTMRGKINWFYAYFVKSIINPLNLALAPNPEAINDFYKELLDKLADCMIVDKQNAGGLDNYAIRPDAIYIEPAVTQIKCDACESRIFVAKSDTLTEDTHCLEYKCVEGLYSQVEPNNDNYYRKVYNRTLSPRIYAHEHTGLLDRKLREEIELEFKEHLNSQSCNVLAATSTLEMGIDIGDLNVVANTGIPPKPSNFLQRVGRAGRKEGSALVLNYAKQAKHDMFYFAEPLSMMQGAVSTPGCFLEAKDILRRHFYAFCIDSWTTGDRNNTIPNLIGLLHLGYDLLTDDLFFANRINAYIKDCHVSLMERFRQQYPENTQKVLDDLYETISNPDGSFYSRVIDEFEHLIDRMEHIRAEKKELSDRLKQIPENDKERRNDILNQNRGLRAQEKAIREESVIEFMTNVGLLPNYAFPETGVKLSATIYSKKALGDDMENTPDPKTIELVRPASQGIRELAPGNSFYAQKLKMEIKGLGITDKDSLRMMRYCSECDALAVEGTQDYNLNCCPKCGSDSWHSNKHKYLKFTLATTNVNRSEAAMDDKNEDREQQYFHTMKHFQFNHTGAVSSYGLKNVAFGIEFCKDVHLTEVNYGNREQMGEPVEINKTQHISNLGFVTCKYCGKTTSVIYGQKEANEMHMPYCNHKDVPYPADEAHRDTYENLYLYRTMQTEAIKVLLPVQLFNTEASSQLFKAGLELGLRYYYDSNPEHLRIDAYAEYNKATQNFDNYLVIYDTIPGGTGYLSKLYNKTEFSRLLTISYEHIRDCECRLEGKDGCYHCILSYGNQWQRKNLSRERAEGLFKKLVDESQNWEDVNGSIGTITTSGVIEDSELEILFVKTMERIAKDNKWIWQRKTDATLESYVYEFLIDEEDLELKYVVTPQYKLGKSQGVSLATKSDFQFRCTYAKVAGEEIDVQTIIQWSVYLDGYAFHASKENMNFYNDVARRESIRQCTSAPRLSWTLTWSDIKQFVKAEEDTDKPDTLFIASPNRELIQDFNNDLWRKHNSMYRFIYMLKHPNFSQLRNEVFCNLASCWTDSNQYLSSYSNIDRAVAENAREQYASFTAEEQDNMHFFVKTTFIPRNTLLKGSAWYPYDQVDHLEDSVRYDWGLKEGLTEINREDWEDFWRRYNLLQFFHNNSMQEELPSIDLDEILLYFPGLEDLVTALVTHHISFDTEGGFELKEGDIIIAEAAIKIDDKDIVIDDFEGHEGDMTIFEQHGFKVVTPENFNINDYKN